ncbi:unnamed protein product [Moneuplotes crassus]|uniref:Uncharacterized protein n=1 Tax=Euplotes crassus TaxID=5936 RepID=A0AAD1X0T4_EUPCR|nr:unnamed protein product [Moneuplotes crassus]
MLLDFRQKDDPDAYILLHCSPSGKFISFDVSLSIQEARFEVQKDEKFTIKGDLERNEYILGIYKLTEIYKKTYYFCAVSNIGMVYVVKRVQDSCQVVTRINHKALDSANEEIKEIETSLQVLKITSSPYVPGEFSILYQKGLLLIVKIEPEEVKFDYQRYNLNQDLILEAEDDFDADSDSDFSENNDKHFTSRIIDIDYGFAPGIYYILSDYSISILDLNKSHIKVKIDRDPTIPGRNTNAAAFQCLRTISSGQSHESSLPEFQPEINESNRILVIDDYDVTIYDIRHMSRPIHGPAMHMIDEGYPSYVTTPHICLNFDNHQDHFEELDKEYDLLLENLEDEEELELSEFGKKADKINNEICLIASPTSIVGIKHDKVKNNDYYNQIEQLQYSIKTKENSIGAEFPFLLQCSSYYSKARCISGCCVVEDKDSKFAYIFTSDRIRSVPVGQEAEILSNIYLQIVPKTGQRIKLNFPNPSDVTEDNQIPKYIEDTIPKYEGESPLDSLSSKAGFKKCGTTLNIRKTRAALNQLKRLSKIQTEEEKNHQEGEDILPSANTVASTSANLARPGSLPTKNSAFRRSLTEIDDNKEVTDHETPDKSANKNQDNSIESISDRFYEYLRSEEYTKILQDEEVTDFHILTPKLYDFIMKLCD